MNNVTLGAGDWVYIDTDDRKHIGKILQFNAKGEAYVRWHRGYASWVKIERLVRNQVQQ